MWSHAKYFKLKLDLCEPEIKIRTNMVASLDFISQLISSQLQPDSIYFDTNSALYPVSHPVLLQTFSSHEFSYVYLI
jgi:hypothetical protein